MKLQNYVDGFLCPVKTQDKERYLAVATAAAQLFRRHGAISVVECWGDDVPEGQLTSMPMAVKRESDEVVVFSWVVWPDKAVRDRGMKAVMDDPEMPKDMPFDGKRLIYGGFQTILVA
ncbi:DUF1428 domain-containing protein [Diaphorobacter ruginosibacter]|uniref:DUF1428 domain-containing protein n=1 Tax=Diaphorobacter ruginosibacter TaxID=1715720 RepID=A0A7G9RMI2_9BURK|nr:DUF1428 domain-containing protein [Diaphorobacter ruginosibacter]QNN56807.1 DUF1428 domain-containing protein [Diaphorobacter ruginosibacter]